MYLCIYVIYYTNIDMNNIWINIFMCTCTILYIGLHDAIYVNWSNTGVQFPLGITKETILKEVTKE